MSLSITKAALAIYPESSKIERHRNINPIGGIKVATVWMPAPTPLASIVIIHAGKWKLLSKWDRPSTNTVPQKISKKSIKHPPTLIVNIKVRYIANKNIGIPPCLVAVATIYREAGPRWTTFIVIYTIIIAWSVSTLFYQLATFNKHPILSIAWIIGICIFFMALFYFLKTKGAEILEVETLKKQVHIGCDGCSNSSICPMSIND
ncbi:hypothetical protein [Desulfothermus okinawensis]